MPFYDVPPSGNREVAFVPGRWWVQQSAVLRAFFSHAAVQKHGVGKASKRLRAIYCKFLDEHASVLKSRIFRNAPATVRARDVEDRKRYVEWRFKQTRTCRQAFRWQPDGALFCQMAQTCPFCWARAAGEAWGHVAGLVFPAGEAGARVATPAYDLVTAVRTYEHDGDLAAFLDERLGRKKGDPAIVVPRVWEVGELNVAAAYEVLHVQPLMRDGGDGKRPRLVTTISQLFAVPAGASIGDHPPSPKVAAPRVERHVAPSLAKVASLVASMCRYPRGLLVRDAGMSLAHHVQGVGLYLEARDGRRLWASYGGFRNGVAPRPVVMDADRGSPPKKRRGRKPADALDGLVIAQDPSIEAPY